MKPEIIKINGTKVELQWGEGYYGLGTAIHTNQSEKKPMDRKNECLRFYRIAFHASTGPIHRQM